MAGIGFELRGLFKERGLFYNFKAYFVSSVVTSGPTLLCIILIIGMQVLLKNMGESFINIQYFISIMIYCFAFSLIITGGFVLLAARYISDCIYRKTLGKIFPSFFGVTVIVLIIDFVLANIFYLTSGINDFVKIYSIILLGEISIIWIESIYITTIKDYLSIFISFFIGIAVMFSVFLGLVYWIHIDNFFSALLSLVIGFLVMAILFAIKIYKVYGGTRFSVTDCFEIITSIDEHPELLVTGVLYYLGMYVHNFVFWFSDKGMVIKDTFRIAPFYDVALFYAFLSIIPITVIFVVKVETSFYPRYKEYYSLTQSNGSVKDIEIARSEMITTLLIELRYLIEVQLFISFTFIAFGRKLLPMVGLSQLSTDIFSILILGSLCYIIMYFLLIILLYFDNKKNAMHIAITFFSLNLIFTLISLFLGESFYGYGFFAAAIISMVFAYFKLSYFLEEIDYYTFASQPIFIKNKEGRFGKLYKYMLLKGRKI
ncbi:MAG: exopolysaccharide Pel transporter PelG [Clostridiaceae bacterium]|nr:exopolysaccharide Pel transporter PelG [Clostridiaceae bacterium]